MDLTQKAKVEDGFLFLILENRKLTPFGKIKLKFPCPNCNTPNEYELRLNTGTSAFLEQEKKCKNCGAEYIPRITIELKGYVDI